MSKGVPNNAVTNNIHETFSYGIIYIYSIPGDKHKGRLKIGAATVKTSNPTQNDIDVAANERIQKQTLTADIHYKLEHAELAVTKNGEYFSDHKVHDVLFRSGYQRKAENKNSRSEWFEIGLETAKNAIKAVKEDRKSLTTNEQTKTVVIEFPFRPNQLAAIKATTEAMNKKKKSYLWNAKMRFGKTSAAMQFAKENKLQKVLIVTHRPSVSTDWNNDFKEIFGGTNYQFGSKLKGESLNTLIKENKPFVYFKSLQDLRLSKRVVDDESSGSQAEGFDKNDEIFDTTWDMLIVDEAHEGTQSSLGTATFTQIPANFTLYLSGTPFNILHKQEEDEVYTWDYVMEQEAKQNWDTENPGVPNPYNELPELSIFTYDIDDFKSNIGDFGEDFKDTLDGAFKFHEFFRVKKDEERRDIPEFVHEKMVKKFLDLLVDSTLKTRFPYATEAYRDHNKHSLWLLPNRVAVIAAMENLLKKHSVFGTANFGIVNISGNKSDFKDEEEDEKDAKEKVVKAIAKHDYTITLTGQRLTTGASVPEWTAVFMMSDTTSATTYLQTAFRCQTPARIGGMLKTQGYVFDFAPDRTLRLIAEAIELNHKPGKTNSIDQKEAMEKFLNFCPILAASNGSMMAYDVNGMLRQLKRAIAERVYRSGFEDPKLYNDELLQLSEVDIKKFNDLRAVVGASNTKNTNEIEINNQGLDGPLLKQAEEAERKKKQELTEDQKLTLEKLKEARKQKQSAISILRAVSIRMPMLVYGANLSIREDITLNKFIDLVDEESWVEFMPAGLTKAQFRDFTKYYDEDVFKGVAHSIRAKAFDCDDLLPTERVQAIADIFSTFKNPDKETVLTPWNVVNKHLTLAFGGHNLSSGELDKKTGKPIWVSKGVDTSIWSQEDAKILEINSKSGLYPLLAAYNVYSRKLVASKKLEEREAHKIWADVLSNHIYVLCKSPMAQSITKRTLAGYNESYKPNIVYINDLVQKLQQKDDYANFKLHDELLEKFKLPKDMKFKAVVGNPPYQINTETNFATPVYHLFFEAAKSLGPDYVSLIHPARFLFNAGATPKEWNRQMLNDPHLRIALYEPNSQRIFSGVDIKGGVCITLWNKHSSGGGLGGTFVGINELTSVLGKIKVGGFDGIVGSRGGTRAKRWLDSYKRYRNYFPSSVFSTNPELFSDKETKQKSVKLVGLLNNKRIEKFVSETLIDDETISSWKIFIPKSNGSGTFGEILSTPIISEPMSGCTESFIQIGPFATKIDADHCLKYIKSKFARAILGTLKVTQDNPRGVWKNIPLQNFTSKSDIDWSKSVSEIDKQLYNKYKLDKDEIDFIEKKVKPMT